MLRGTLLALLLLAAGQAAAPARAAESLDAMLTPYLAQYGLPALGAAVVKDGQVIAVGAVGTRRAGAQLPVSPADRFHIGSDTKAITALLAGILVDEGRLRWDSTPAELFPELAAGMDPGFRAITLEQMLAHLSGIPGDNEAFGKLLGESFLQPGNLDDLRYWLVGQWRGEKLASPSGTRWAYANMNYVLAGAMIERATGRTWEELLQERVLGPLGLASAGFGPQASLGKVDAPLGHLLVDGKPKAMLAGPNGDNPLVIGPAGTVHMSLLDFAAWAGWNAGEQRRGPVLVKPETMRRLHAMLTDIPTRPNAAPGTPKNGRYGLGWGQVQFDWAAQPFLFHGGSNTMNLAHILVQPATDLAMVLMTNISGPQADAAFIALEKALYERFRPATP
ncbi:MAG: serine hydrolase domain-containing protein [Dongiaceae bacterium]